MQGGPEEYLTAKEVARLFKVHPKTIRNWSEQGKFPKPVVIEGEMRWRQIEIWQKQIQLAAERETTPAVEPRGKKGI